MLAPELTPVNADVISMSYHSTDESIATVLEDGLVSVGADVSRGSSVSVILTIYENVKDTCVRLRAV